MEYLKLLEDIITDTAKENASDLHLSAGRHPMLRVAGQLIPLTKYAVFTPEDTAGLAEAIIGKEAFSEFKKTHHFMVLSNRV